MATATATFAFDKKSARSFDSDGRMRVRDCVISVPEVNPYYGREIPRRAQLALDANSVYDLYRDPEELARAADSFNGPLMIRHVVQTADEPRKEYVGGVVYNSRFTDGKLRGDLLVTDKQAIEYIESGEMADLSCGYRYTPDMTPGTYEGRPYHGVMRNIEGNHVALVENGRATGAHVADSALPSQPGANSVDPNTNPDPAPTPAPDAGAGVAQALLLLTQKLESIDIRLAAVESTGATPAETDPVDPPVEGVDPPAADSDPDEDEDDKPALDAASVKALVDAAVTAERDRAKAVEQAKTACRGDLGDMIALDSAPDIYRAALKERGVDVSLIPAGTEQAAYQAIQAVAPGNHQRSASHAQDGAHAKPAFDTSRIRNLGR